MNSSGNTTLAIRRAVARTPVGQPFASKSMFAKGGQAAVQKALSRLVEAGALRRMANGIFVRPETSRFVVGDVPPDTMKVVQVIAARSGAVAQVHGAHAAVQMGLTTQLPVNAIFQTSGPSRKINVGKQVIRLQRASPRKLVLAGRPAGVALTALWYLGKAEVQSTTFAQIEQKLGPAEFNALIGVRAQMPAWMAKALDHYLLAQPNGR
jgi:hypothetical protein